MRFGLLLLLATTTLAEDALKISVNEQGLQSLTYRGVEYGDATGAGRLGFTGGAAKLLDAENQPGKFATTPTSATVQGTTVTQTYPWGQLTVRYTVKGDDLDIQATLTNTSAHAMSSMWLANLCQLNDRLKFDATGKQMHWDYHKDRWGGGGDPYTHWNFADPHVYWWNDGATKIIFVDLDPTWETGVQRLKTASGDRWVVTAGGAATVRVALRFRSVLANVLTEAADAYGAFGRANPLQYVWTDRRPIGVFFVAESAKGWPKNPNGWFNDEKLDVTTAEGRQAFAQRLLARVDAAIAVLKETGAQAVIWWDVEGARYPHPISYIGDPRMLPTMAPEMDEIIDLHHAKMIAAGLKTGICIRPTEVWFDAEKQKWSRSAGNDGVRGEAKHADLKPKDLENWQYFPVVERLAQMIALAQKRWQATIFYIDTNGVYRPWGDEQKFEFVLMEAAMLKELNRRFPGILLIPELPKSNTGTYHAAYALHGAQYGELDMGQRGLPNWIRRMHPTAFGVTVMSDGDFAANRAELLENVKRGDVLMVHGWWWPKRNDEVLALYQEAFPGFSELGDKAAQFPGK